MAKTFLVSDESRNYLGMVIITSGIDINQFKRNPVMFYMHDRTKGVIGRWDNIRKNGKELLADAVFDDSTELGNQVKNQVENGFLRCASIGIEVIEVEKIDGVDTVTKSVLTEVSIVDIPGNYNALKLHKKIKKGERVFLTLDPSSDVKDLRTALIQLLQLGEDASEEEILTVISRLVSSNEEEPIREVENAIKEGLIPVSERSEHLRMARISPGLFRSFVSRERDKRKSALEMVIDNAIKERKIICTQRDLYLSIGERIGVNDLSQLVISLNKVPRISDLISREGWTLEDYRRNDPLALKRDPALYKALVEREERKLGPGTLEYYRKYEPEYLKDHPEEYNRLLKQGLNN